MPLADRNLRVGFDASPPRIPSDLPTVASRVTEAGTKSSVSQRERQQS